MPKKSGPDEPNLELPSFGLRRRRRRAADPAAGDTAREPEPTTELEQEQDPEPTAPTPAMVQPVEHQQATQRSAKREPAAEQQTALEPAEEQPAAPLTEVITEEEPQPARRPSPLRRVPGPAAAVGAGILCGLVGIVLTIGSLRGCEAVRGVGTCGGIGLFALLAILVVEIFIGAAVLRSFRVRDAFSTSFLGVGLAAVAIVLFLLSHLDSLWMLLVVPLVTAAAYLLSWWVTATFIDTSDDRHR